MQRLAFLGPDRAALGRVAASVRSAPAVAPATFAFLAACVAVFAVAQAHGSTEDADVLVRFGATERAHVWAGEYWRLATAALLHIGAAHLLWNVAVLPGWCIPVERAVGTPRFVVLLVGAAIGASAFSLVALDGVSAGASGAGYGVIAAHLVLARRRAGTWRGFLGDRTVGPIVFWSLLWTAAAARDPRVDHAGHLGGFVAGAVVAWAVTAPARASAWRRRLGWAAAALAVAVPVALAVVPGARQSLAAAEAETLDALGREDVDRADRALARAADAGLSSPALDFARALVLQVRGDLDGAERGFEALARSPEAPARLRAAAATAAKKLLGARLVMGSGIPPDEERGLRLLAEACAEGDADACTLVEGARAAEPEVHPAATER